MNLIRILYHIARADFLERTRRYSFLVTIGVLVYLVYLSLPPITAKYLVIGLGDYRGIYNSAWIGSSIALLCNTMLSLIGFYLINNAIKRDYATGVGQIIATTPLSKGVYLIGKMLSNLVFLMAMVGIITVVSIGMQFYRGESYSIDIWEYLSPILLTTLPLMALVSAVALLFESVRFLRGGIGNIIYYGLFMLSLMASMGFDNLNIGEDAISKPFGVSIFVGSMQEGAYENFPDYDGNFAVGGSDVKDHVITFEWNGVEWTAEMIIWRLFWLGTSFAVTMLVTLLFNRFDQFYEIRKKKKVKKKKHEELLIVSSASNSPNVNLTQLIKTKVGIFNRSIRTIIAELKIMLKGLNKWWYAVAILLIILSITTPIDVARKFIIPLTWLWPILVWSKMGNREIFFRTNQYVFSSPFPVKAQLPAVWLAGFIIALIIGIGWPIKLIFTGEFGLIGAWLMGAAFIPSLALAAGIWSGGSKLFEVVYFILWYVGPMNQTPFLDYIGITGDLYSSNTSLIFMTITLILICIAVIGRRRQIYI